MPDILAVVILKSSCFWCVFFSHEKCVGTLRPVYMDQLAALTCMMLPLSVYRRTPVWLKYCHILQFHFSELRQTHHHHHHHHIHFRALFSSTEGWAFWQVFLEGVLSTQNDFEGQQNPYQASFCHSQALHPMISLACQIFSVQPHSACVLLQSSLCCALHAQTIDDKLIIRNLWFIWRLDNLLCPDYARQCQMVLPCTPLLPWIWNSVCLCWFTP